MFRNQVKRLKRYSRLPFLLLVSASLLVFYLPVDLILPNGQLISEKVTNWTHGDNCRRLELNVRVGYDSDPEQVLELLMNAALKNSQILDNPEPNAVFMEFGDSTLKFKLRAWTIISDQWKRVYSDLAVDVHKALKESKITIPFPNAICI